ncbi:RNA dependent RNA polymerase-domain-containing protein [Mycena galopus ATCC 62051]|nr:RNA dependent RNA polymerase-domain-containing protein [Mycena galopus ATCC 62051]
MGSLFTDGCSSISVALAKQVWKALRASQRIPRSPSALQFRCGGAKGVLVQNPDLPGKTLFFRPSQTKFEAGNIRTLDIAATSSRPILAYLNRPLIALLEYHGTPPRPSRLCRNWRLMRTESQGFPSSSIQVIFSARLGRVLPPTVPVQ